MTVVIGRLVNSTFMIFGTVVIGLSTPFTSVLVHVLFRFQYLSFIDGFRAEEYFGKIAYLKCGIETTEAYQAIVYISIMVFLSLEQGLNGLQ